MKITVTGYFDGQNAWRGFVARQVSGDPLPNGVGKHGGSRERVGFLDSRAPDWQADMLANLPEDRERELPVVVTNPAVKQRFFAFVLRGDSPEEFLRLVQARKDELQGKAADKAAMQNIALMAAYRRACELFNLVMDDEAPSGGLKWSPIALNADGDLVAIKGLGSLAMEKLINGQWTGRFNPDATAEIYRRAITLEVQS